MRITINHVDFTIEAVDGFERIVSIQAQTDKGIYLLCNPEGGLDWFRFVSLKSLHDFVEKIRTRGSLNPIHWMLKTWED